MIDDKDKQQLIVDVTIPAGAPEMTLRLYNEPVVTLHPHGGQWVADPASRFHRLSATDLRILATSEVCPPGVPASRALFKGFDPAKHAPITDLHTHSSRR